MIYQNIEIYNAAELFENEEGSISWIRVPKSVEAVMEREGGMRMAHGSTGVELRFVLHGEAARITMAAKSPDPRGFATFHVYRGSIQGGWEDHEVHRHVTEAPQEFVIKRSGNMENLKKISAMTEAPFDPEVIRVIFDRGTYRILDVQGDMEPPAESQCPAKTLLFYGSSITHGSNSIDASHTWASVVGHRLKMDVRNLGMAGACCLEPAMAEYIAAEGEKGCWDAAVLELGINVLSWSEEKIRSRSENIIRQVAGRNPHKPVFVISPFYYGGEDLRGSRDGDKWRAILKEITEKMAYPNVRYIHGPDILGDISGMSADEIHPNIYGVQQIADRLTQILKESGL